MNARGIAAPATSAVLVLFALCAVAARASAASAEPGPGPAAVSATASTAAVSTTASNAAVSVTASTAATVVRDEAAEGRGHFKKMMMNPYMLIPQLITLGFAPIVLANLKMLVMNALMINNMALNAAIFMTVRNMVFGPRPKVKYVNYGYRGDGHAHRDDGLHQHHPHQHHHGPQQPLHQQPTPEDDAEMAEYRRRKSSDAGS